MELVFQDDAYAKSCAATVVSAEPGAIRLDRSVFYPTGGGQPVKGALPGDIIHVPADDAPLPAPGDAVTAALDWQRRHRLMRMHTCLHLLCAVVDGPVTGGQISDGKGRLDFDLSEIPLGKDEITAAINRLVDEDHPANPRWVDDAEFDASPALVKTMSVAPPRGQGRVRLLDIEGVDLQACGGTHVARTGEIGKVRVAKIENKGRHNRRVVIVFDEA